jgi:hypothetical protein
MAICSGSFEEAEQVFKERTHIRVNDDTIRKVTDALGEIWFIKMTSQRQTNAGKA